MRKIEILKYLVKKGYKPVKDLKTSKGDTVYKYILPSGDIERLYILESFIDVPFWGMTKGVVERLANTVDAAHTILLSDNNQESYIVNKKDIIRMCNGSLPFPVSTDEKGNFKLNISELKKINSIHVEDDVALTEFIVEQL